MATLQKRLIIPEIQRVSQLTQGLVDLLWFRSLLTPRNIRIQIWQSNEMIDSSTNLEEVGSVVDCNLRFDFFSKGGGLLQISPL